MSIGTKKIVELKTKRVEDWGNIPSSTSSKQKMIPIRSLISKRDKPSITSPSSLGDNSSTDKIIPLKFYPSQSKKSTSSDGGVESDRGRGGGEGCYGVKRERLTDSSKSEKVSKKPKRDKSFEAVLSGNAGRKKKHLVKTKTEGAKTKRTNLESDVVVIADDETSSSSNSRESSLSLLSNHINVSSELVDRRSSFVSGEKTKNPSISTSSSLIMDPLATKEGKIVYTSDSTNERNHKKITKAGEMVKPHPSPSFSILSKKEIEFNGEFWLV